MMSTVVVALLMAALSVEAHTSGSFKSTLYSEGHSILKVLREMSHQFPSARNSWIPHAADGGWWITKISPKTRNKRQDVSSYNLNSFGLRYGK
ncbi:metastasis-suppressor KiSS-1 [Melanotaenia boesemani]|uniref:metastasis-suppressor KiSS-1 n=1 Tax=Melanotaenia boesemani TaxID=1250792 RepID=UPI001C03FB79|nr:metastasis-suppressor KiSS-1 [Melanotaenia boesemani]